MARPRSNFSCACGVHEVSKCTLPSPCGRAPVANVHANSAVTSIPKFGLMAFPPCSRKIQVSRNYRRAHCECSVRDRHKRIVGLISAECDACRQHPGCPLGSNGDVGTSRLESSFNRKTTRSYAHPKEPRGSAETNGRNVGSGSFATEPADFAYPLASASLLKRP